MFYTYLPSYFSWDEYWKVTLTYWINDSTNSLFCQAYFRKQYSQTFVENQIFESNKIFTPKLIVHRNKLNI